MDPLCAWKDITLKNNTHLDPTLLDIIDKELAFPNVTKVQNSVIPLLLSNKDVCVKACTGSGKTLAFVVPLIQMAMKLCQERKLRNDETIALILAPSRELAMQIF